MMTESVCVETQERALRIEADGNAKSHGHMLCDYKSQLISVKRVAHVGHDLLSC